VLPLSLLTLLLESLLLLLLELLLELLLGLLLLLLLLLLLTGLLSLRLLLLSELRSTLRVLSSFRSTSCRACALAVVAGDSAVTQSRSKNGAKAVPFSLLCLLVLIACLRARPGSGVVRAPQRESLVDGIYTLRHPPSRISKSPHAPKKTRGRLK
jgi:hypothetical protein